MSALAARTRRRGALRTIGMLAAIALGGVAVYLVVVGHSQKQVQVGLLVGLWGVMLGAFTVFGPRRGAELPGDRGAEDVERTSAQRREHELQLEVMLRREMERVLRAEMSQLHTEVSGLRNDLVEKVNGQLRLERIETTRVISSDIEELQHEVRRLAGSRGAAAALDAAPVQSPTTIVEHRQQVSAPLPYVFAAPSAGGPGRGPAPTAGADTHAVPGRPAATRTPPPSKPSPPSGPRPAQPSATPSPAAAPGWAGQRSGVPVQPAAPVKPALPRPVERPPAPAAAPQRTQLPPAAAASHPPQPAPREPAAPRPAPPPVADHATSVLPRQPAADAQRDPAPQAPSRVDWTAPAPASPRPAAPPPAPAAARPAASTPAPAAPAPAAPAADPFAGMPRLSRFEDDWPGQAGPGEPRRAEPAQPAQPAQPTQPPPATSYVGRRRSSSGAWSGGDDAPSNGSAGPDRSLPNGFAPTVAVPGGFAADGGTTHGRGSNGTSSHGISSSGTSSHGISSNGASSNGASSNGTGGNGSNGAWTNGGYVNGTSPNGTNPPHDAAQQAGGRRRRADGEVDEVLARLLGR